MNVSIIADTEGRSSFCGVVYLWDGQAKKTLFRGTPHAVSSDVSLYAAERRAYKDALEYMKKHFPVVFDFAG